MTPTDGNTGPDPAEDRDPDGTAVQVVTEAERAEEEAAPGAVAAATSPELMANSLAEYARLWMRRVRSGESGRCRS
jgi:hypothetical protein